MSEHLEIEFKTLVSPQDFKRLIDHFAIQNGLFTQTNHYFDTDDFQLKAQRMGLRIRVLADRGELTLKVPAPEGLLEINDPYRLRRRTTLSRGITSLLRGCGEEITRIRY